MEQIESKGGMVWNVISKEGKQLTVTCAKCGHELQSDRSNLRKRKACPGCKGKPTALKQDAHGNCITICRMGQLEYIHRLVSEEDFSETEASRTFIEAVQAHSEEGDPITSELTVESVRAQYRRDSGKKKDKPKPGRTAQPEQTESGDSAGGAGDKKDEEMAAEAADAAAEAAAKSAEAAAKAAEAAKGSDTYKWSVAKRLYDTELELAKERGNLRNDCSSELWAEMAETYGW